MANKEADLTDQIPLSDTEKEPSNGHAVREEPVNGRDAGSSGDRGLNVSRHYTTPGVDPFELVEWDLRTASISGEGGETVFEQKDAEIPAFWSQLATNVVVSKYFRGPLGTPKRESSVRHMISRITDTITEWGVKDGYFAAPEDAQTFHDELTHIILHQKATFNSPVWFNVGVEKKPQASACFILAVEDSMESILDWCKTEGMIFKGGSGSGINLSKIRSSRETLSAGGQASGPVSFMRAADSVAGSIKSGGKTRRAAKMVVLNIDHPDVVEFIRCKANEERKAYALGDAGWDMSLNGEAWSSIQFQNANNSVRVTEDFLKAVEEDRAWELKAIISDKTLETHRARDMMKWIAEAAWQCGDPGMQYDTTINDWHTCSNTDRINASNPCFPGDALVLTNKGYVSFYELMSRVCDGEEFRVATDNITSGGEGIALTTPECFMVTGYNPVFRLAFSNGMEIRCTKNHRFFTQNRGMVPAEELTREDRIALCTMPVEFPEASVTLPVSTRFEDYREKFDLHEPIHFPNRWSEAFAEFLGHLVGDGSISGNIVTLTYGGQEEQEELVPRHAALLGDMMGQSVYTNTAQMPNGTFQLRVSRAPFRRFLEALGVRAVPAAHKVVPASLFQAPQPVIAAFLRGLFTADGCVANQPNGTRYVGLGSKSRELLQGVQTLLSTFGIFSRIYTSNTDKGEFLYTRNDGTEATYRSHGLSYDLRITGRSLRDFHRHIKFALSVKSGKLRGIVERTDYYETDETVTLMTMEPDGVALTYNLTEPANHSYIVNGFVVANCSEYMHLDNSACNLASINLLRYLNDDGTFDVEAFQHTVDIMILAQDIIVDNASYPTRKIGENARTYRQLGLGYANLGALLMSLGLPYDSDGGRAYAGAITALMTGRAYRQSACIAEQLGPFKGYKKNREPMLRVIGKHRAAVDEIEAGRVEPALIFAARNVWEEALALGKKHGFKNAQATVLAPTGTIAFMMDCDTTGIEPDIALVKYKRLVGGGVMKIVNHSVHSALKRLGYGRKEIEAIAQYIDEHGTIEGAPYLKKEHLPVFDCAFRAEEGTRSIRYMGHIKMMAAAQPFISGAISKTVNLPNEATVEDVMQAYLEGGRLGLKALAIYRDGSKRTQPLSTRSSDKKKVEEVEGRPVRRRLPEERQAITHKFSIVGHEGYLTVGMFEDGQPGEIFLRMSKEGSTVSGLMDAFATSISVALQYGVPLDSLVRKFSHMRFEPAGFTGNKEIPIAKSIMDYIFRWLALKFLPSDEQPSGNSAAYDTLEEGERTPAAQRQTAGLEAQEQAVYVAQADAPSCPDCGSLMTRNGSCYVCRECGTTSGCS